MRTLSQWLAVAACTSLPKATTAETSIRLHAPVLKDEPLIGGSNGSSGGSVMATSTNDGHDKKRWGDGSMMFLNSLSTNESRLLWFSPTAAYGGRGGPGSGSGANGSFSMANMTADPCAGDPVVVTRTEKSNGNCLPRLNEANASCTCVTRNKKNANPEVVVFRLRLQSPGELQLPVPLSVRSRDGIDVTSATSLAIPASLRSLSFIGELKGDDKKPLDIPLGKGGPFGMSSMIFPSESANLTMVYLANLDLHNVTNSESFLPVTVTNLTLRNCNIPNFNIPLIKELGYLEILDLSGNGLTEPYERPQIDRCVTGICPLKSLDISDNQFTKLPATVAFYDTLEHLDLRGNPITNITVSSEVFDRISSLQSFYLTAQTTAVDCGSAMKKSVHDVEFCVVGSANASTPTANTASTSASDTNTILTYGLIGGCAVVAVLVFIILRQRRGHHAVPKDHTYNPFASINNTVDGSAFDETFYNTGTASLLNDPIIITRRVELSDIRVANCISKGGFGVVYSGVYRRRRRVAIKKIRPEYNTDTKMIETFLREICLMATLRHARIVEFIGVAWESPRDLCAVTEFMDKGDVRELLKAQRARNKTFLTWENTRKTVVALHVAEALQYLHSLQPKVIHRDLKAKNVLLNAKFEAKLSDFGISRERHLEETHMTAAVGTSFWIAPEVLQGRQDYDERADIYSFGVVLCEIDTEDYPFWTENHPDRGVKSKERAILHGVASGLLRPQFSDSCPLEILTLAESCLDADPENRPTARELVEALGQLLQSGS